MTLPGRKGLMAMAATMVTTASVFAAGVSPVSLKWVMGENTNAGNYTCKFVVKNTSGKVLGKDWKIYFNQFPRGMNIPENSQLDISMVLRNYYYIAPNANYKDLAPGDSIVIDYTQKGNFQCISYSPDGAHFAYNGHEDNPMSIKMELAPLTNPKQWTVPGNQYKNYPDGKYMYELNEMINPSSKVSKSKPYKYEMLPALKSVETGKGYVIIPSRISISAQPQLGIAKNYLVEKLAKNNITAVAKSQMPITLALIKGKRTNTNDEFYTISVSKEGIVINGNTEAGVLNGVKTLIAAIENSGSKTLPVARISDYPDCSYRGMMLDVARNYTPYEGVRNLIDVLASYKINKFQFHFNDDEGWRLEIPGLPELTKVGSRKGLTRDEHNCIIQTFAGNGNPDDMTTTANGYITAKQFIELLKFAKARGVEIIPEIETPGHARAAIVSMKARYNKYKDVDPVEANKYRLWDLQDTSKYLSVQGYPDNVMNLAEEGTYRFIQKVIDEIADMYKQAGVTLPLIHLGGDEVAKSAWDYSPAVQKLMKDNGLKGNHGISEYYFDRITEYTSAKGIKAGGWQEVALDHSAEYNAKVSPRFGSVTVWSTVGRLDSISYHIANLNYPMVMCNVNNFYLDMMYNRHQDERGLNWGGTVDEFDSWNAQPFNAYRSARQDINGNANNLNTIADNKPGLNNRNMLLGVQAELWSETIRGYDWVQYYVFPKIFGMVERGWNSLPAWGEQYNDNTLYNKERAAYNLQIGEMELPKLAKDGVNFRIGQPGIIVKDGMLYANSQYPGEEVRYTLDGSEPNASSALWTGAVPAGESKVIRAKSFYLGKSSVSTYLFR